MRWLIAEDSLCDRRGHWYEYLGTFCRELPKLGDEVTLLADHRAEPFIVEQLGAKPVLPPGIFLRMGDGAGPLRRYARVPLHAWHIRRALTRWFRRNPLPDLIFVPTVIVHHLLGWTWLIKRALRQTETRVLLFFPNTPIQLDAISGQARWDQTPTARLFKWLICSLAGEVAAGRVILGTETRQMQEALTALTGVTARYLPHPVSSPSDAYNNTTASAMSELVMGSYGSARHEKGTDVLIDAIERHLSAHPSSRVRFAIQIADSFTDSWRKLANHPRIEWIADYFQAGEYAQRLARTHALLLPYRRSSYGLRVSRVVIEAMVHGLPVVATERTSLSSQADEFGAGVWCSDGDPARLAAAIHELEVGFETIRQRALQRRELARRHFSVETFRALLQAGSPAPTA